MFSKSLALKKDKEKRDVLKLSDLTMKKPGNGLKMCDANQILGKKLKNKKSKLSLIRLSDFEK